MLTNREEYAAFWRTAFTWKGSVTPKVIGPVIGFSLYSLLVTQAFIGNKALEIGLGPFEVSGAVLGLLMVLRTNAGYERWWEARKLWGGIVNQCRNIVISSMNYGPEDIEWKKKLVKWVAAFPHVSKRSLRAERALPELSKILSQEEIESILRARHMPIYVVDQIADCIATARKAQQLDNFSFLQIDKERTALIDHIGACERILRTPIPLVVAINIRQFILLFLILVPFVLVQKVGLFTPLVMMVIAYPLFSIDQIGIELQNPFNRKNLSHLPLNVISDTIEGDVFSLLDAAKGDSTESPPVPRSIAR